MNWLEIVFGGAGVAIVSAIVAWAARMMARQRLQHVRFAKYFGKYQGYHLATSRNMIIGLTPQGLTAEQRRRRTAVDRTTRFPGVCG